MMEVLDAGADDFEPDGETFVVYTAPDDVSPVAEKISAAGYKLLSAQVEMLPQNGYIKLTRCGRYQEHAENARHVRG